MFVCSFVRLFVFHVVEDPDTINFAYWSSRHITDLEISLPAWRNSVLRVKKATSSTIFLFDLNLLT